MTTFKQTATALLARGYRVIPIPAGRKGPVFDGWEKTQATPALIDRWTGPYVRTDDPKLKGQTGYAKGNIGVLTEHTPAVDLDILDAEFAREMEAFVSSLLGDAPMRVGRAPKRLLVFRTEKPFTKMTSGFFISRDGEKHRVEVLGAGQQFVGYGIHPDTQKPYEWVSFDELSDIEADDLPLITPADCKRIIDEFERRAAERGWLRKGASSAKASDAADDDDFMAGFKQRLRISDEEVAEALKSVPGNDDYDQWLKVGMALHHQYEGSDEGLQHWIDWSESADNFDEDALRKRWEASFAAVTDRAPTTFASILKIAKENRKATEGETVAELRKRVAACASEAEMIDEIAKDIAAAKLSDYQVGVITKLMQLKLKVITSTNVSLGTVKGAIKQHMKSEPTFDVVSSDELEIALAKRVLTQYFAKGAHIKRFGKAFWIYRNGVWRREDDEMIERRALETLVRLRKENNDDLRTLIARLDESRGDRLNALCSTVLSVMAKMVAQSSEDDPLNLSGALAPRVVNCANGEVWFNDDGGIEFKTHDPAHLLTTQVRSEFDEFSECPTFDASIRKVFQKADDPEDVIRHFYEVMGYIIQPSREAAIWVMFKGPGSNGKSFLLSIISDLMGIGAVLAHPLGDLAKGAGPHFTDSLPGKLMMLDDDLKKGVLLPDDWLKKLSEAKLLTANPKFGKTFQFVSRAVPVILTNNWPSATDLSDGLQRRIMAFESPHRLADHEKDPNHLRTILRDELPGVLNHLISGFQRFLRRGSRFDVPAECERSKARLMENANTLVRFKMQALEAAKGESVEASKIYEAYCEWMSHWEVSGVRLGRNSFYNALDALGMTRLLRHKTHIYRDVRLLPMDDVASVPFDDESEDGL